MVWIVFPSTDGSPAQRAHIDWRETRPAAWQHRLARWHGARPRPRCPCDLELAVHRRASRADGDLVETYHLARMPDDGPRHRAACPFGREGDGAGRRGEAIAAIRGDEEGRLDIRLDAAVAIAARNPGPPAEAGIAGDGARPARNAVSLLGLLRIVWERARLHHWTPRQANGARRPRTLCARISEALDGVTVNGIPAAECALPLFHQGATDAEALRALALRCQARRARALLVSELRWPPAELTENRGVQRLTFPMDGARDAGLIASIDAITLGRWQAVYPYAAHLLRTDVGAERPRVIVAALARLRCGDTRVFGEIGACALMETSANLIPIASGFERQLADALVANERRFTKPLRWRAGDDATFPDFVLHDISGADDVPMEVFGMDDENYAARRARKIEIYDREYGPDGWWYWDAALGGPMPGLPPRG